MLQIEGQSLAFDINQATQSANLLATKLGILCRIFVYNKAFFEVVRCSGYKE